VYWGRSVANLSVLSGRLEEFKLVELLQVMGMNANTGALHLEAADGRTGLVYFDTGALVSCIELDTEALTLGHILQQLNLATSEQIEQAFHQQTQDPLGKRIGERLVDVGILAPEQLNHALAMQTLWTAREVALWNTGTYELHPGERLPADTSGARIDPQRAVMEVLRYEQEWEELHPFLPEGMRTHVAMVFDPPIGHSLLFAPEVWHVITHVNRFRTVRRIATSLRQPEVEVARIIGPLVRDGLLVPIGAAGGPGLPEEAQRMSMRNFDLFTLLIGMEQDWLKRKTPRDQLVGLASFINQTMHALEDACRENGLSLAPTTLETLFGRRGLQSVQGYQFRIANNRIDIYDFSAFCGRIFESSTRNMIGGPKAFYDEMTDVLQRGLEAAFHAINARIASPIERVQNQEAWEALFMTFRGQPSSSG
jgi:hypothetical protein